MSCRPFSCTFLALALVCGQAFGQQPSSGPAVHHNTHSIMHFTREWMREHHRRRVSLPVFHATGLPGTNTSVNLSSHMNFAACGGNAGWDQGQCGNCWVFGSTAASSVDDGVASGTPQLFSTQWFDSDYYATGGGSTCDGGDDTTFAEWYNNNQKFIPWSNTGAAYADGNGPSTPATPASSISQNPFVGVTKIGVTQIATSSVSQAQAIANIKAILDNNQAVILSFFLPDAGWTDFDNSWDSDSESTPWAGVDKYSGQGQDGGHLVCVVGYDDTSNIWLVQNSWGTTSGRPNGRFALSQTMNYADSVGSGMDQWEFDAFTPAGWSNASTSAPTITTQPASQRVVLGATATFKVTASGSGTLAYQWYKGATAISGATAASYTTPATTAADNGTTFHVTVSNPSGSVTSSNATLTVGSAPVVSNLVVNGGFESGTAGWTAPSGVIGQFGSAAPAYAGTWDAWLGRETLGRARSGVVSQTVTIPSSISQATLTFYLQVNGGSNGSLMAEVCNSSGSVLATLATYGDGAAAAGYQERSFDLSAYKGQTIQVAFAASLGRSRNRGGRTSFVLDNVSLDVK
jgi:hypothetical protein